MTAKTATRETTPSSASSTPTSEPATGHGVGHRRRVIHLAHRELIGNLVARDVKARYKQSIFGFAWAILNPLLYAMIYTIVFRFFLKQGTTIPTPVFAYFGLLYWNLFATGLSGATESLVAHISLITKVYFPREVFPISSVLAKLVDCGFGFVGLIPLLIAYHVPPSPLGLLLNIPLVALLLLFTIAVGMFASCANLFYRDVRHLIGLALNMLAFLVPNMYPLDRVPLHYRTLYLLNPVAVVIESARRLAFPAAGPIEPLLPFIGIAALTSTVLFVIGYTIFKRNEPRFAEFI